MTILYPTPAPVKSRKFAAGLFRSLPTYRADHTAADEATYNAMCREEVAENRRYDEMALEAARIDRLCRGPIF